MAFLNDRRRLAEVGFCVGIGIWVVTDRYVGLFPPGDAVASILLRCSVAVMYLCAAILGGMWARHSLRTRTLPVGMIVLAATLIAAELFWRFVARDLPLNSFKVVAMVVLVAQPAVAAAGVAAAVFAARDIRRRSTG